MADVLLTLIMPSDIAQEIEDLLLAHPFRTHGFTASDVEGHGASLRLVTAGELVSGHAPRRQIQTAGPESDMNALLALIKQAMPHARIFFWLQPLVAMGRL